MRVAARHRSLAALPLAFLRVFSPVFTPNASSFLSLSTRKIVLRVLRHRRTFLNEFFNGFQKLSIKHIVTGVSVNRNKCVQGNEYISTILLTREGSLLRSANKHRCCCNQVRYETCVFTSVFTHAFLHDAVQQF